MTPEAIHDALQQRFGEAITAFDADAIDPTVTVATSVIHDVGAYLHSEPGMLFDSLMCLSGVDYGEEQNSLGVVYHLHSTALRHAITLRVEVSRQGRRGADGMRHLAYRRMARAGGVRPLRHAFRPAPRPPPHLAAG